MGHLSLSFLGPFRAQFNGTPVTAFDSAKVRALLAYLAVESDRAHAREVLAGLLWSDCANRDALSNLRGALANLREAIHDREANPPYLFITRDTIQFNVASDSSCDVVTLFQQTADQSNFQNLQSAIGLYHGAFLEGFSLADSPAFEEWVLLKREQLNRLVLSALHRLADHCEERGEYERAQTYARQQLELEPWDEQAHQQLMRLLAFSGQRSAALAQYEMCHRLLKQELQVAPSRETTALYETIRDGKLAKAKTTALDNLPIPLTSFIGRQNEMAEVKRLLTTTRLLTLTGAGGCGKTRLALQAAQDFRGLRPTPLPRSLRSGSSSFGGASQDLEGLRFPDGVWWVDLAALNDPVLVSQTVGRVLGLHESPQVPILTILKGYLRAKELLLVFDNCEHLIDACARLIETLLSACQDLQILLTSRQVLGVVGELTWRVPSLAFPDLGAGQCPIAATARQFDAIQLFAARAEMVAPQWNFAENTAAVVQICARLDGMPLAIELAAARLKVLSAQQIAQRLDNRFRLLTGGSRTALLRHQTLRATMDWSYDLLSDAECVSLRRLAVFVGGWTLEAAEAIGGQDPILSSGVLDLLTALVDKSLVIVEHKRGETRYRLLETVREYSCEKLVDAGEAEQIRNRHLHYFVKLAEAALPEILTAKENFWAGRLENDIDNIRAALAWGIEHDLDGAARLASSLHFFWDACSHLKEGRDWLERIIPKIEGWGNDIRRARVLNSAGNMIRAQMDPRAARPLLEESLSISEAIGARHEMAFALLMLGNVYFLLNDAQAARTYLDRALPLYRELGAENFTARAIRYIGMVAMLECDWQAAEKLYDQSLALARRASDRMCVAGGLRSKANLANKQGDYRRAKPLYEESLAMCEELPSGTLRMQSLWNLAFFAMGDGDYPRAKALLQKCVTLDREQGSMTNLVRDVRHLGGLCTAVGKPVPGARLLGAAVALHAVFGGPMQTMDQRSYNQFVSDTVAAIGKEAFDKAWQEGRKMTLDEAIDYALENLNSTL